MPRRVNDDILDDAVSTDKPEVEIEDEDLELDASADDPDSDDADDADDADDPDSDDADDADDADTDVDDADPEPPRQTRGRRQFSDLRKNNRALSEQLAEERRRSAELASQLATQTQSRSPMETPEVRRARLAAMEPSERTEFLLNEFMQNQAHERQVAQFQADDNSDKARFETLAKTNPKVFKKYHAEVEHRLRLLRQSGQTAPRQTILQFLLGEAVLKNRDSPRVTKRRDEAAGRVRQQQTKPARNRGESGASSGPSDSTARMKRLENMRI